MPLSDYTDGLANSGEVAYGLLANNPVSGATNATGFNSSTPPNPKAPLGGPPEIHPTKGFWGRLNVGVYHFFGLGFNTTNGALKFTPFFVMNAYPQPLGAVPPELYGIPENWLSIVTQGVGGDLEKLVDSLGGIPLRQPPSDYFQTPLPPEWLTLDVAEFSPSGLISFRRVGEFVDP